MAAYLLLARACRDRVGFGLWLVGVSASAAVFLGVIIALWPGSDADARKFNYAQLLEHCVLWAANVLISTFLQANRTDPGPVLQVGLRKFCMV